MTDAYLYEELRRIYKLADTSGESETFLKNVHLFWVTESTPKLPMMMDSGMVFIAQGEKIGYLNGKEFKYNADNYLISSVPTAFECETRSTKDNPLYGIYVEIDFTRLNHLIEEIEIHTEPFAIKKSDIYLGVEPIVMDETLHDVVTRLLKCLQSPLDSKLIGASIIDELLYRVLLGPHGNALVALMQHKTYYARIADTLSYLHENYMHKITIEDLAQIANMSITTFYRSFKTVTGESPMQYLKKVRLNTARFKIVREGLRVKEAASEVGYESVSQFGREFKRFFNTPPSEAKFTSSTDYYMYNS